MASVTAKLTPRNLFQNVIDRLAMPRLAGQSPESENAALFMASFEELPAPERARQITRRKWYEQLEIIINAAGNIDRF
jgi:hypothetical protein